MFLCLARFDAVELADVVLPTRPPRNVFVGRGTPPSGPRQESLRQTQDRPRVSSTFLHSVGIAGHPYSLRQMGLAPEPRPESVGLGNAQKRLKGLGPLGPALRLIVAGSMGVLNAALTASYHSDTVEQRFSGGETLCRKDLLDS